MKYLLVLSVIFSSQAFALDLYIDDMACVDDDISMSVDVELDDYSETFTFDCDWSGSESFETDYGTSCEVEAEMCDNGSDYGTIEVQCDNGDWDSEDFPCTND